MAESEAGDSDYEVYTDGSYLNGRVTYAFVILRGGEAVHESCGVVPSSFAGSRQVGGEIFAVLTALAWFEENGVAAASVHYDFENLALWVRGVYKANTHISQALVDAVRGSRVRLSWRKVRAHTGVRWNERVDELAKSAAMNPSAEIEALDSVDEPAEPARPTATATGPLIDELERVIATLQEAAADFGIKTKYMGILNGQFARLELLSGDKRVAMFDLYNTQKKRLNPFIHPAGSREAKRMAELWEQFILAWR